MLDVNIEVFTGRYGSLRINIVDDFCQNREVRLNQK